jgi:hypothetical protein
MTQSLERDVRLLTVGWARVVRDDREVSNEYGRCDGHRHFTVGSRQCDLPFRRSRSGVQSRDFSTPRDHQNSARITLAYRDGGRIDASCKLRGG